MKKSICPPSLHMFNEPDAAFYFTESDFDRNKRFQELLDAPSGQQNWQGISEVLSKFVDDATGFGYAFIEDLCRTTKLLQPLNAGGTAGGLKYKWLGLFIKLAVNQVLKNGQVSNGIYATDHLAAKAARAELRALRSIESLDLPELRFPLFAVIRIGGFTFIAQSIIPIDGDKTLVYGSCDGGRSFVVRDSEAQRLANEFGRRLNLAPRLIVLPDRRRIYHRGPLDLEIHRGKDGRYYIVDAARLFPPASTEGSVLTSFIRPTFLYENGTALVSDCATKFLRLFGNDRVRAQNEDHKIALRRLHAKCSDLSALCQLMMVPEEFDLENSLPNMDDLDSNRLRNRLLLFHTRIEIIIGNIHRAGFNLRQLGLLGHAAWEHLQNEETPGGLKGVLRTLIPYLFLEGISRTLKNMLFADLRIFFRNGGDYLCRVTSFLCNIRDSEQGFVEVLGMKMDEYFPQLRSTAEKFSLNLHEELRSLAVHKRFTRLTGITFDPNDEIDFTMLPRVQVLICLEIARVESLSREADENASSRESLTATRQQEFDRVANKCVDAILAIQKHVCEAPLINARLQDLYAKLLSKLQYTIGVRFHALGKYRASIDILRTALQTDCHNVEVMYHLAQILQQHGKELGLDTAEDEALNLLEFAATVGHDPDAAYRLGCCFFFGEGTESNKTLAKDWFGIAANNGHIRAQWFYGILLLLDSGSTDEEVQLGVERMLRHRSESKCSLSKAMRWIISAANKGDTAARQCLGNLCRVTQNDSLRLLAEKFYKATKPMDNEAREDTPRAIDREFEVELKDIELELALRDQRLIGANPDS